MPESVEYLASFPGSVVDPEGCIIVGICVATRLLTLKGRHGRAAGSRKLR